MIHRDTKPSTILVNEYLLVKLCDLDLAECKLLETNLQSTHNGTMRGSYLFMALGIRLHSTEASEITDIWALACMLLDLHIEKTV